MGSVSFFMMLLLIWFVLISKVSTFMILAGIFSAMIAMLVQYKMLQSLNIKERSNASKMRNPVSLMYMAVIGTIWLIRQVLKSSIDMTRIIWSIEPKADVTSFTFTTQQSTDIGLTLLSNSITLTPGTITLGSMKEGQPLKIIINAVNGDNTTVMNSVANTDRKVMQLLHKRSTVLENT